MRQIVACGPLVGQVGEQGGGSMRGMVGGGGNPLAGVREGLGIGRGGGVGGHGTEPVFNQLSSVFDLDRLRLAL